MVLVCLIFTEIFGNGQQIGMDALIQMLRRIHIAIQEQIFELSDRAIGGIFHLRWKTLPVISTMSQWEEAGELERG